MVESLPDHVPIEIDQKDIDLLINALDLMGFSFTPMQILRTGVVFSKVKQIKFNNQLVELHVRIYHNGKITAEFEPRRLRNPIKHIFSASYSAHEWVISVLKENSIDYHINEGLRFIYNMQVPDDFPFRINELLKFMVGCIFHYPLGLGWMIWYRLRKHFFHSVFQIESQFPNEQS